MPVSYWVNNGELAYQLMEFISQQKHQVPERYISKIKKIALNNEQEFMGEPTFAKSVVQLIEKINVGPEAKLNLILDAAKITIIIKNIKTKQPN